MRRWENKQGNFIGYHYIFDVEQEAACFLNLNHIYTPTTLFNLDDKFQIVNALPLLNTENRETFRHWTDPLANINDWVRTDDGRIVQLLNRYYMPRNAKQKPRPYSVEEHPLPLPGDVIYVKFAFTSATIWYKIDGTKRYAYLHADCFVKYANRGGLSGKQGKATTAKRLFAYYLVTTGNPITAYNHTYPGKWKNKLTFQSIKRNALLWMRDRTVLDEVLKYMDVEEYRKKLQDAADAAGVDVNLFMTELKRGIEGAKAGEDNHQAMLKMVAEVIEKVNGTKIITAKDEPEQAKLNSSSIPVVPEPIDEKIRAAVNKNTPELLAKENPQPEIPVVVPS